MDRRKFVKSAGILAALGTVNTSNLSCADSAALKMIKIIRTQADFEREKLIRPFGFKGGFLTELWQVASRMHSDSGISRIGLGTQSVLYGDADLFSRHSESDGNAMMFDLVKKSLEHVKNTPFRTPIELLDKILPAVIQDGKSITGKQDLNTNFVFNALVGVDNAAWLTYAAENKFSSFETMIPDQYKMALSHRNKKIAIMYQIPYGMPMEDLKNAAKQGYFVFKIKTGAPGSQSEMLKADIERLSLIHETLKEYRTEQTENGKLIYTMDANARYEKKDTLLRYLDHARKIGAIDQILLIEEPLNEKNEESVADIDIRIGADESVHDEQSAKDRLDLGYKVMVLKGIAKTLSMSVKIAKLAQERNVSCMCADLTVNPILIDWNKNLAAHLAPFPVINMGMMETNGDMNYLNWKNMVNYHPAARAPWMIPKNGVFELSSDFYERSGGIFEPSDHYESMF
jgi:L-alanine-DL-glutamate epimerase-like enolase superfamily enzyme